MCSANGVTSGKSYSFIEGYTRREIIWDPQRTLNFNKMKEKLNPRKELAKEINRTVDKCRKKIQNLLSALRRDKMKMWRISGKQAKLRIYN